MKAGGGSRREVAGSRRKGADSSRGGPGTTYLFRTLEAGIESSS
jgi:hypothetical protein